MASEVHFCWQAICVCSNAVSHVSLRKRASRLAEKLSVCFLTVDCSVLYAELHHSMCVGKSSSCLPICICSNKLHLHININIPLPTTKAMASEATRVSPQVSEANSDQNVLNVYHALDESVSLLLIAHLMACARVFRWSRPVRAATKKTASELKIQRTVSSYTTISLSSSAVELYAFLAV